MAQLVKTISGLAIASVNTIQGLAIASAKTVMGLDNTSGGGATFDDDFSGGAQNPIAGNWTSGMGGANDMARTAGGTAEGTGSQSMAVVTGTVFTSAHYSEVMFDSVNGNGPSANGNGTTPSCYVAYGVNSTTVIVYKFNTTPSATQVGADITTVGLIGGVLLGISSDGAGNLEVFQGGLGGLSIGTRTDPGSALTGTCPGMYSNGFAAFRSYHAEDN